MFAVALAVGCDRSPPPAETETTPADSADPSTTIGSALPPVETQRFADAGRTGVWPGTAAPLTSAVSWTVGDVVSRPCWDESGVYVVVNDGVRGLGFSDGGQRWTHPLASDGVRPRSVSDLAVGTGRVLVGTFTPLRGEVDLGTVEVLALDAAAGGVLWREAYDEVVLPEYEVPQVLLDGDAAILLLPDRVLRLDASTGLPLWTTFGTELDPGFERFGGGAAITGEVLGVDGFLGGYTLFGIDLDSGAKVFQTPTDQTGYKPLVAWRDVFYREEYDGPASEMVGRDAATGEIVVVLELAHGGFSAWGSTNLVAGDGSLIVVDELGLVSFARDGTEQWRTSEVGGEYLTDLAAIDDLLVFGDRVFSRADGTPAGELPFDRTAAVVPAAGGWIAVSPSGTVEVAAAP